MLKKIITILLIPFLLQCTSKSYSITKQSKLAGTWYPDNAQQLSQLISSLTRNAKHHAINRTPMIIVPHAGYTYSAYVASKAYGAIVTYKPDIIIIIGPSHYEQFTGFALPVYDAIATPLGTVAVDQKTVQKLSANNNFVFNNNAFEPEHSVEIQLPFIQYLFPGIPVIPILAGSTTPDTAKEAGCHLLHVIAHYKKPLFIISSDFTHHGPRFFFTPCSNSNKSKQMQCIKQGDQQAIDYILSCDADKLYDYCKKTGITICGVNALIFGLSLYEKVTTKQLAGYATSADITGDFDNTVSYAAIVIDGMLNTQAKPYANNQSSMLSDNDKAFLLSLARQSIQSYVLSKKPFHYSGTIPEACLHNAGAFVTITIQGNLRGCIGYIEPIKPLYQTVIECAASAASSDPRFEPLSPEEYSTIRIEISVLSPLKKISSLDELTPGKDGLVVVKGNRRGVLLPQVAKEFNFTKEEFFQQTCNKAGVYPFEYDLVTMYTFTATVFHERTPSP